MRQTRVLFLACLLCAAASVSALAAIDADYEYRLLERVRNLTAAPASRGDDAAGGYGRCGTPMMMEIKAHWDELSPEVRAEIAALVDAERPALPEYYDTPDGLFRIHFARTGPDSVDMDHGVGAGNVPNYILNCAEKLEITVAKEVDDLGFRLPPSDTATDPLGDGRYDIYFLNLLLPPYFNDFYGFTIPDRIVAEPGENTLWTTSFMILHSNYESLLPYRFRPFEAMAVTVAHEFHHASHWSYDAFEAEIRNDTLFPWFLEMSATAMEELVFDNVNDYYLYLDSYFEFPWLSLRYFTYARDARANHPYASCVWMLYLIQKHDQNVIREIWDVCKEKPGFNTFEAFSTVLEERGSSLEEAWAEFVIWNFFTGDRAAPWSYEEAERYASVPSNQAPIYTSYPAADASELSGFPRPIDAMGVQYLRFAAPNTDTSTTFRFKVESDEEFEDWMVVAAGISGLTEPEIKIARGNPAYIEFPRWDEKGEILVAITPFTENPTEGIIHSELHYSFIEADIITPSENKGDIVKAYPNPMVIIDAAASAPLTMVLRGRDSTEASAYIYTVDGHLVIGGKADTDGGSLAAESGGNVLYLASNHSGNTLTWNGMNRNGQPVATGVYLAVVQVGGRKEVVKIAVKNR